MECLLGLCEAWWVENLSTSVNRHNGGTVIKNNLHAYCLTDDFY